MQMIEDEMDKYIYCLERKCARLENRLKNRPKYTPPAQGVPNVHQTGVKQINPQKTGGYRATF